MYSALKFIVPLQYRYGLASTQASDFEYQHFDGDPNTSVAFDSGTDGQASITLGTSVAAKWLFVDGEAQLGTGSNTGAFIVERGATVINIANYYTEYGKAASWVFAGVPDAWTSYKRDLADTTERLSILLSLSNSTLTNLYGVDIQGGIISPAGTKIGYVFSEDFAFQLWNRDKKVNYSFNVYGDRSDAGNYFDDWQSARSNQMIRVHTFQWNELTEAKMLIFESFMNAFGGNIERPFIMVRTYSGLTEAEFYRLIITEKTIAYSKTKKGTFDLSFSARELSVDY